MAVVQPVRVTSGLTPEQEAEKKRRIRLTVAACSYELFDHSLVSDAEYDRLSSEVDLSVSTDREDLDMWWELNFDKSTGMWIYNHPELERAKEIAAGIIYHKGDLDIG